MLQELGEKLQPFASYETGFPQGLVNMLACNWRELTEGTDCNKWHQKSLAYESVRSRRRQASEEAKNGAPGSKCMQHEIPAIRKDQYKRSFALSACATKEKRNAETASNTPLGSKAPVVQNHTSQSPVAISFSLSSKICEERGWIFQPSDSNAEDLPYVRALKRLQQIQKQISTITMMFNQEGGLVTNKDGEMAREWKWPRDGKLAQPVIIQVNEYITVRIAGRFAISLIYNWQHESVCLSLSPLQGAALPQLEELPKLTELLKKYKGPEETISHVNDISAARELRKLQRKIRSIVEDWLEHYRTALVWITQQTSYMYKHMNTISYQMKAKVISQTACPAVLRRIMMGEEGKTCRCSNRKIPNVSDLEYDHLINNQMSSKEQIVVVCVSSSSQIKKDPSEDKLEQLYERKNKNRSMPCAQGCLDSFRLLKYDITSADAYTDHKGSLLVQRHNVAPGMFLMYIQGKLLFANYIFNGYSKSTEDLQKQVAKTRSDYRMGYCLPSNFRFSTLGPL
nr:PREDICTED: uncharacterized protein C3orf20 homolog [Struthio camelus australis]